MADLCRRDPGGSEILRDNRVMGRGERQQFLDAIIDGNGRLTRAFERMNALR